MKAGPFAAGNQPAAQLSAAWREWFRDAPDGDFARFGLVKKYVTALDSALRRRWIEKSGYHRDGLWQYRLTECGKAKRDAARESVAA